MNNPFHMIEYIYEGPTALENTLIENKNALRILIEKIKDRNVNKIILSAVGSSYTAAQIASPLFHYHCDLPITVTPSTEVDAYADRIINKETLFISISRSGERGWVVNSLKRAVELGAFGVAMTGVPDSLMAKHAHYTLITREGKEITFPKTKSVLSCCGLLMQIALELADQTDQAVIERRAILTQCPALLRDVIDKTEPQIIDLIPQLKEINYLMAGGSLGNYGVALEFGIKLQETAGIQVTSNDCGNVLHGPWGGLDQRSLVTLMATAYDREIAIKILALAHRMSARCMAITEQGVDLAGKADYQICLPLKTDKLMSGIFYLIPVQLITYHWAIARGLNPDTPEGVQDMLNAMLPPGRQEP